MTSPLTPTQQTKQYLKRLPYLRQALCNLTAELSRWDEALATLPEAERQALQLFYRDGLGYVAMSFRLHYSERTCKRLVKSGLEHLALMMYGDDGTFTARRAEGKALR